MKKIAKSLSVIVAVAAVASFATWSYFSDEATVLGNTISAGTLEIRVNGQETKAGFEATNFNPGDCVEGQYDVNNYGKPHFSDISTLDADKLVMYFDNVTGDLCPALTIDIKANRGWPTPLSVYSDGFTSQELDLLTPNWSKLAVGDSERVFYKVCMEESNDDQSGYMGTSCVFDFVFKGSTVAE